MIASLEKGSSIKYNRNTMVKAPGRSGYVMDITTPDSTYKISSLRQTVFEYPANPIVKPGATKTPTSGKEESERTEAEEKLKQIWNSIGNSLGRNALEEGWAESFGYLAETLSVGGQNYQAHGMGKSGFAYALRDLFELLNKGIDPNRGGGQLYTAPLAIEEKNKAAASAIGTAGGTAYTDGAFVIVAKKGTVGIKSIDDIGGILVNSGLTDINPEILTELRKAFPDLVIESYNNAKGLVEQLNQKTQAPETPDSDIEAKKQEALEKKIQDLEEQRRALRSEDGSVPADKMAEFNRLNSEIKKAKEAATRGNSTNSMLIKRFADGADTATTDPEALSAEDKKEAADIIEQVIQNSKSADEAFDKIRRLGYVFDIAVTQALKSYLNDRFDPAAPKVGNNKDSFQAWIYGKTDKELAALEGTKPEKEPKQTGKDNTQTEPTPRESAIQAAEELIKTAPSKAKNIRKDIEMMRVSDAFIGSKAPETKDTYVSATEAYQRGWGTAANPSDFTGITAVMISGSGTWNPKQTGGKINNEDINRHFQLFYKPLIDKAINQGVTTFNVGNAAGMDKMVSDYLEFKGFQKTSKDNWNEFKKEERVNKDSYEYLKKQAGVMVIGENKGASVALWDREKLMWRFFNKKQEYEYSFKKSKQLAKNLFRNNKGWFKVWWNQILNDAERKEIFDQYYKAADSIDKYSYLIGEDPSNIEYVMLQNLRGTKFRRSKELTWATDVSEKAWFTDDKTAMGWDQFIMALKGGEDVTGSGVIHETTSEDELRDMIIDLMKRNPRGVSQKTLDDLKKELSAEGNIEAAKENFFDITGVDFDDFMTMYEGLGQTQDIYYIDRDTYEVTDPVDKIQFVKREPRPKPAERINNVAPQFKGKVIYITTDSSIQEDFGELGDGVKTGNEFIENVLNEPRIVNRLMEIAKDAKKSATSGSENDLAEGLIRALSANIIDLKDVMYYLNPLAATNLGANNARTYLYQQALKNAKEEAATGTTVVFDNTGALPFYNMFDVIIVNPLSDIKRDAKTDNINKAEKAVPADKRLTISAIYGVDILKGTAQQTGLGDIRARIGAVTNKSQLTLIRAELNNAMTLGTLDKELALAGTTYEEVQSLIATKKQEVANQLEIKDIVVRIKEPVIYEFNDNGTKLILIPYNKGTTFVSFHDVTDKFENLDTVADLDLRTNAKFRTLAEEDINQNLRPMTVEEKAPKPKNETVKKSDSAQSDLTNDAAARIQKMKAKRTAMDRTSTDDSLNDLFNKCSS